MYAQLDSGNDSEPPIENTFVEWAEAAAEPLLIGQIEFDQQNFENSQQEGVCDSMSFNPGRYHPAHRPLSNMGRGRIFAYQASAKGRGANFTDLDEQKLFDDLRQVNKVK